MTLGRLQGQGLVPEDRFAYACRDRCRLPLSVARVMRHFLLSPLPVDLLTVSMETPPTPRLLVATTGRTQGLAPRCLTAPSRAVAMSPVAPRADVDRPPASIADVTAAIRTALQDPNLDQGLDENPFAERYSPPGAPPPDLPAVGISRMDTPPPVSPFSHPHTRTWRAPARRG